jgi:hypothetical protein
MGLEGIVSKRLTAPYLSARRGIVIQTARRGCDTGGTLVEARWMRSKPFLTNVVPIHGFKAISMWSTGSNCDAIFDRTLPTNVTTSKLSRSLS